jgi:hypothetical protein
MLLSTSTLWEAGQWAAEMNSNKACREKQKYRNDADQEQPAQRNVKITI